MPDFKLEERYLVLKIRDIEQSLTTDERKILLILSEVVNRSRKASGRPPLECLVIEKDWPEYDSTLDRLVSRVAFEAKNGPSTT